jgi:hypothetical protein
MADVGRKSKYDEYVKPYLEQITEWAKSGATEKEICYALGIAQSTFYEYKKQFSELSNALRVGRQKVILDVKAALYKKAIGFEYEEKRGVKKGDKVVSTEIFKRYSPPDTTAAAMLLRNYEEEWRDKDSVQTDFRRQEIEIKKALAEANNFGVDFD